MQRIMGASGAESRTWRLHFHGTDGSSADHSAVPAKMTKSELMTVMTSGMAHVSGAIMALYISYGVEANIC